jgi:C1A family cysteine protease
LLILLLINPAAWARRQLPESYTELLKYVQKAPDQGETNTCWFMASTGALELLLNKRDRIRNPRPGGKNDLSESFLIWQPRYYDSNNPPRHFIEEAVQRFNHGEAVHHNVWPFSAYHEDGTDNFDVWKRHPDYEDLPRLKIPKVKTSLLFARGKKWDTYVLNSKDIQTVKEALVNKRSPVIINYNDDGYWHVVLIVGYDDKRKGECYELKKDECNHKGLFYVRDSNGKHIESRAYNWFLYKGNAAAVIELTPQKEPSLSMR